MKTTTPIAFVISLCLLIAGQTSSAQSLKKWQDKDGNWHFGDTIPPEFAQQGHEEISKQGIVKEVKERAKTDEELAEEKRLLAIEKEEKKKAEAQAREDKILLDTFSSIEDIESARDDSIATIQSRINLTEKRIEKIKQDLNSRIQQAANQERNGQTPNEALLVDIESLQRQIKTNEISIEDSHKEQEMVKTDYQKDIDRFKALKSGSM